MQITVNIPDELAAQARVRGVPVEKYVQELLSRQVEVGEAAKRPAGTSEEIRKWLDSLAQFSDRIPPLPETISREWIYQDHD